MAKPALHLIVFLALLAYTFFMYGIIKASYHSLTETPEDMPEFLSSVVMAIHVILATNLGAVLGIAAVAPNVFENSGPFKVRKITTENGTVILQILACYFYISALAVVFVVWITTGFTEDEERVVSVIPAMGKSLLGIMAGALTIYLNGPVIKKLHDRHHVQQRA